jgi:hypothetical protein
MQLNKVLKGLMIALPVMAIAACSSNKNASNDQSGEGMMGAGTGMDANGNGNMAFWRSGWSIRLPFRSSATDRALSSAFLTAIAS